MSNMNNDIIKETLLNEATQDIDNHFPHLNENEKEKLIDVLAKIKWEKYPEKEAQQKFEEAWKILKQYYMYMGESEKHLNFKHSLTRQYIHIDKMKWEK
tara:strand:- start:211 stop:507 length:297 start_codon:yes stop_codon:yes gene_type:complete